ncbi:MAG: phosphoadenosine phosphosulfate reductase family protein [Rhodothermaceae bacterium]|nr:phosphoadenosine phosphosulfate reductase family protein [Rhodothermaceae bacterium]MYF63718.1 phosphoadenosine phosphosulfate reductase family protein [Rhodothermaceae bacterium]
MIEARHIVAFSGGKDSSALAIYLHNPERWGKVLGKSGTPRRLPLEEAEYVFCDTGTELAETYDYLDRLEAYLGRPIRRLRAKVPPSSPDEPDKTPFDHYLELYGGFLPSPNARWCTRVLKLKPFEDYIGEDPVVSYVGIRADEGEWRVDRKTRRKYFQHRKGYISTKPNITTVFPFIEDGLEKADIYRILHDSGVGYPEYYHWRSRSGCYFCFFQRKSEWVGLLENHPELFERAKAYEKVDLEKGERFTWSDAESLEELSTPERIAEIKHRTKMHEQQLRNRRTKVTLMEQFFDEVRELDNSNSGCNICHL